VLARALGLFALTITLAVACTPGAGAGRSGSGSGSTSSSPPALCGMSPDDWCPAPAGDPCNAHRDVPSCRADKRCKGMGYKGESVVACLLGPDGFATNCPTVGCISR
jgi:hypothetical protein